MVRRLWENLTLCLTLLALLFLPVALSLSSLYAWADAGANADDPLWQAKHVYLNAPGSSPARRSSFSAGPGWPGGCGAGR